MTGQMSGQTDGQDAQTAHRKIH